MITQKKSSLILITALMMMALVTVGCERSYAPSAEGESQATPTMDASGDFPVTIPADMEGVYESGAQTSTAIAIASGAPPATATTPDTLTTALPGTPDPIVSSPTAPVIATNTALPPTPSGPKPSTYILKKGEFPYCIARRFNIDPGELLALNSISSAQAQTYQPGLTLSIPQSGGAFPPPRARNAHPVDAYTVPQNTTVYGVACYFGDVDPAEILSGNTIADPNNIAAGTVLKIP